MDYLVYVAHDAENLQFFLWYRDYVKRFHEWQTQQQNISSPAMDPFLLDSSESLAREKSNQQVDISLQYPLPSNCISLQDDLT